MKRLKVRFGLSVFLSFFTHITQAQPGVRVVAGMISLDDIAPTEKKYALYTDTLERRLKSNRNDTTSLFYRALLYLQFNSFVVNPEFSNNHPAERLLVAKKMVDRADGLKMSNFQLKVLRAQISKELTYRYAPIETWRFNDKQLAERKKWFEYYKGLANQYYDGLALMDSKNAYDYERLKVH